VTEKNGRIVYAIFFKWLAKILLKKQFSFLLSLGAHNASKFTRRRFSKRLETSARRRKFVSIKERVSTDFDFLFGERLRECDWVSTFTPNGKASSLNARHSQAYVRRMGYFIQLQCLPTRRPRIEFVCKFGTVPENCKAYSGSCPTYPPRKGSGFLLEAFMDKTLGIYCASP
jgi:hypothetical protein